MEFQPGRLTRDLYESRRNTTTAAALAGLLSSEEYQAHAAAQQQRSEQAATRRSRRSLAVALVAALAVLAVLALACTCPLQLGGLPAAPQPPLQPLSRTAHGTSNTHPAPPPSHHPLPLPPSSAPAAARGTGLTGGPLSAPADAAARLLADTKLTPRPSPSWQLAMPAAAPAAMLRARLGVRPPRPIQQGFPRVPGAEVPLPREGTSAAAGTWRAGGAAALQAGQLAILSVDAQRRGRATRAPRSLAWQAFSAVFLALRSASRLLAAPLRRLGAPRSGLLGAWPGPGRGPGHGTGHAGLPSAPASHSGKPHSAIAALPQAGLAQEWGLRLNATTASSLFIHAATPPRIWPHLGQQALGLAAPQLTRFPLALPASQPGLAEPTAAAARPAAAGQGTALMAFSPGPSGSAPTPAARALDWFAARCLAGACAAALLCAASAWQHTGSMQDGCGGQQTSRAARAARAGAASTMHEPARTRKEARTVHGKRRPLPPSGASQDRIAADWPPASAADAEMAHLLAGLGAAPAPPSQRLGARDPELASLRARMRARDAALAHVSGQPGAREAVTAFIAKQLASRDTEVASLREQLRARDAALASLWGHARARKATLGSMLEQLGARSAEAAALRAQLAAATTALTARDTVLASTSAELASARAQLAAATTALTARDTVAASATTELASARAQLAAETTALTARNAVAASATTELASAREQLTSTIAALAALQGTHAELTLKHQAAEGLVRGLCEHVEMLGAQLEEAQAGHLEDHHAMVSLDGHLHAAEGAIEGQRALLQGLQRMVVHLPVADPDPVAEPSADLAPPPPDAPAAEALVDAPAPDAAAADAIPDPAAPADAALPADVLGGVVPDPIPDPAAAEVAHEPAGEAVPEAPAGAAHTARCGRVWGGLAVGALLARDLLPGPAKAVADTVYLGCTVTGVVGEEGKAALGAAGRLLLPRLGA